MALHWFRKGLRLHDNPALLHAIKSSHPVYPVFVIDPRFHPLNSQVENVAECRYRFLLDCLADLDHQLRNLHSRLIVLRGNPHEQLVEAFRRWDIRLLTVEVDSEPYATERDALVFEEARERGIHVHVEHSHTLHSLDEYRGRLKPTYSSFLKLFHSLGPVRAPAPPIRDPLPLPPNVALHDPHFDVPTWAEVAVHESQDPDIGESCVSEREQPPLKFIGGETEALERLRRVLERRDWVRTFEKPKTSPNSLEPSTTVLSPYVKFGALSVAHFYHEVSRVLRGAPCEMLRSVLHAGAAAGGAAAAGDEAEGSVMKKKKPKEHSQPPVSLHGQLLWREFYYAHAYLVPNFERMEGNPLCRQIPWVNDEARLKAWKEGRTGYPFIDAIMTQLRKEGWIHHLARHAVACFLTRGDLWVSWEEGAKVFEEYLIDHDWSLNRGNWLWVSSSAFFHQYFRVYSPVAFGKKTDRSGEYIRKYLPQLARYPNEYIYEPWKAPKSMQQRLGCVIGVDYPAPIVDHAEASAENMAKMKAAFGKKRERDEEEETPRKRVKR